MVEVYKYLNVYKKFCTCQKFVLRKHRQRQHNYELERNFVGDSVRGYQTITTTKVSKHGITFKEDVVTAPTVSDFKDELVKEWKDKLYKL